MPAHDWSKVSDGTFHAFHVVWTAAIMNELNQNLLPATHYAMAEQWLIGVEADVLTMSRKKTGPQHDNGASSRTALAKPRMSVTAKTENGFYAQKNRSIAVREVDGGALVAVVEIVSRGNKDSQARFGQFLRKNAAYLNTGINLLIVDLHKPGRNDPHGINHALWEYTFGDYESPKQIKPLAAVSYEIDEPVQEYLHRFNIGDELPEMPLFLEPGGCVHLPLEKTYQQEFAKFPAHFREILEAPS